MNQLVEGNEPLELADGTFIDPSNGLPVQKEEEFVEVPSNTELLERAITVRRRLSDFPAPPKEMNMLSVVMSYTLYGLSDRDIAIATGLTEEQVGSIKMLDIYKEYQNEILKGLLESDADAVRDLFVKGSHVAALKINNLVNSEDDTTAMSASKDVLDRAGHRPADIIEHRHRVEGGLTIEIVKRSDKPIPTLDLEVM